MTQLLSKVVPIRRTLRCQDCGESYAAADAIICDCVTEHRSLRCPSCDRCSCTGRAVEIRSRFQNASPDELLHVKAELRRSTTLGAVPENPRRPLVVVADDNFDIRNVVKRLLTDLGYGVILVGNGEEAWDAVLKFHPEIALLDGLMPKADGRVIAKRIKDHPDLNTKTVIMTSLYTSAAQRSEAFREFLVDGYLAKPVKSELLKKTLEDLLMTADVRR
jgi:CheY-like chemotaxis protein